MRRWLVALLVLALAALGADRAGTVLAQGGDRARGVYITDPTDTTRAGPGVLAHISSVTHVSGLLSIRDDTCLTCKARVDHYNALANQPHISGALNAFRVSNCGTTATIALASNPNRRDLYLQNGATSQVIATDMASIFIGLGATGHVALTAANGFVLHAGAHTSTNRLYLPNYQGPISCIGTTAGSPLQILEILR